MTLRMIVITLSVPDRDETQATAVRPDNLIVTLDTDDTNDADTDTDRFTALRKGRTLVPKFRYLPGPSSHNRARSTR